jgi:putative transposase
MTHANSYYRRNLPHWQPQNRAIFITCRLYGSLPQKVVQRLKETQSLIQHELKSAQAIPGRTAELKLRQSKILFAKIDSVLDKASTGPRWLGTEVIAKIVEDALLLRCADLYRLWSYVVMVNHLHFVLTPKRMVDNQPIPLQLIMKNLKGYTAREANLVLGRTRQPFWQQESFDHWARDGRELIRIINYVENNPVNAGLVDRPEDWRWSSASERKRRGWTEIQPLT